METIESLLISRGELERICAGNVKLSLWRALHKDAPRQNPFYPDFEPREVRMGIVRAADILVKKIGEIDYVIAKLGQARHLPL